MTVIILYEDSVWSNLFVIMQLCHHPFVTNWSHLIFENFWCFVILNYPLYKNQWKGNLLMLPLFLRVRYHLSKIKNKKTSLISAIQRFCIDSSVKILPRISQKKTSPHCDELGDFINEISLVFLPQSFQKTTTQFSFIWSRLLNEFILGQWKKCTYPIYRCHITKVKVQVQGRVMELTSSDLRVFLDIPTTILPL